MKEYSYDFVFSLGAACSCTESLRRNFLQRNSYPLDWLYGSDLAGRINFLLSDFDGFLEQADLHFLNATNKDKRHLCDIYKNERTGIVFNHDFPAGIPLEKSFAKVKQKYERRIERLYANIKSSQKILMVFIETPCNVDKLSDDSVLLKQYARLEEKFPNNDIDLLYFINDPSLKPLEYTVKDCTINIAKVTGNYKSQKQGDFDYAINKKFFKKFFAKYRLNMPILERFKWWTCANIIKRIPEKSYREYLSKKFHVQ